MQHPYQESAQALCGQQMGRGFMTGETGWGGGGGEGSESHQWHREVIVGVSSSQGQEGALLGKGALRGCLDT